MAGLLSLDDLQQVDVVSPKEAGLRQASGSLANGDAAPNAMVIDTQAGGLRPAPRKAGILSGMDVAAAEETPPQDTRGMGEILNEGEQGGIETPRQAGIVAKGMIKGAASPLTLPADISIGAVNFLKKHALGMDNTLNTNASDLLNQGLTKAGFPEAKGTGEEALDAAAGIAGGAASSIPTGTGKLGAATADKAFWSAAGPSGSANKRIVNALWARKIGEDGAEKLTPDVLAKADDRIGTILDQTRSENHIYLASPEEIGGQLGAINGNSTPANSALLNNNTVQKIMDTFKDGHATAEDLGNLSSQLGKAAKSAIKTDYELGSGLFKVKDYMEGLIQEGLEPGQAAIYGQARQQYKALQQLMARSGHINPGTGDINAPALGRFLQRTDQSGYAMGRNTEPAYEVLRRAQGAQGDTSLLDTAAQHSALNHTLKAVAQSVPGGAQIILQRGLQPGLRALANKPGFMAALSQELARGEGQEGEEDGT